MKKLITIIMFVTFSANMLGQNLSSIQRKAESGDNQAQLELGMKYLMGEDVEKKWRSAIGWLQKSARSGNAIAQTNLACVYFMINDEELKKEAIKYIIMAVKQDDYYACLMLGNCYMDGKGVEKDFSSARYWYEKAIKIGEREDDDKLRLVNFTNPKERINKIDYLKKYEEDDPIIDELAKLPYSYNGDNKKSGFRRLLEYAKKGNPRAQGLLGSWYLQGIGTGASIKDAVYWTRLGAQGDDTYSISELAVYYAEGLGIEKSIEESKRLHTIAAERGWAHSCYSLGVMYGEEQNYTLMEKWYKKACDHDFAAAFYNLSMYYCDNMQYNKALDWLQRAARLADQNRLTGPNLEECIGSIFNSLGNLYIGVDNKQAEYWYKRAIDKGNVKAQMNLDDLRKGKR